MEQGEIAEAVKVLLKSNVTLFDSMVKQIETCKELRSMIEEVLHQGMWILFSFTHKSINLGIIFGFLKEEGCHVTVANRIFERYLLEVFMREKAC